MNRTVPPPSPEQTVQIDEELRYFVVRQERPTDGDHRTPTRSVESVPDLRTLSGYLSATARHLGVSERTADNRSTWVFVQEVLRRAGTSADVRDEYLFAIRVIAGLDSYGDDTPVPKSGGLAVIDLRHEHGMPNIEFRQSAILCKAFVVRLLGNGDPTSIKRTSPVARAMAKRLLEALVEALGVSPIAQENQSVGGVPMEESFRVRHARRLNRAVSSYPEHLTPVKLTNSLTLSTGHRPNQSDRQSFYSGVRTQGGNPALQTIAGKRRAVVLGDPGFGKSTILAALVVENNSSGAEGTAVFVRAVDVAKLAGEDGQADRYSVPATIDKFILPALGVEIQRRELASVGEALTNISSSILVVDGLDEVTNADELRGIRAVLQGLERLAARIIVSSRFTGYRRLGGRWEEFSVDYLDPKHAKRFIRSWYPYPSAARDRALLAIKFSDDIRQMVQVPVVAGLVAYVAEDGDVPLSLSALYAEYFALFLERRWGSNDVALDESRLGDLHGASVEIAWLMSIGSDVDRPNAMAWTEQIRRSTLIAALPSLEEPINYLMDVSGALVAHGRASRFSTQYRWLHRTLHEHLTGVRLAGLVESDVSKVEALLHSAIQYPSVWLVALQHMIDSLDEDHHVVVFQIWADLARGSDPGRIICRAITGVFGMVADLSHGLTQKIGDLLRETNAWGELARWDPERCRRELRLAVQENIGVEHPASIGLDIDDIELLGGSKALLDGDLFRLIALYFHGLAPGTAEETEALRFLEQSSPVTSIRLDPPLLLLDRAPFEPLLRAKWEPTMSEAGVHEVVRIATQRAFPANFHAVQAIEEAGYGSTLDEGRSLDIDVARLLYTWQVRPGLGATTWGAGQRSQVVRVLEGELGDVPALIMGFYLEDAPGAPIVDRPHEWATVGNKIASFTRAPRHGDTHGGPLSGVVPRVSISDLTDPARVVEVFSALHALRGRKDRAAHELSHALVDLWVNIFGWFVASTEATVVSSPSPSQLVLAQAVRLLECLISERDVPAPLLKDELRKALSYREIQERGAAAGPMEIATPKTGWRRWLLIGRGTLPRPEVARTTNARLATLLEKSLQTQSAPDEEEALVILEWAIHSEVTDFRRLVTLIANPRALMEILRETSTHPNLVRHAAEYVESTGGLPGLRATLSGQSLAAQSDSREP